MSYAALKNTAKRLSDQASFLVEIANEDEYEQALVSVSYTHLTLPTILLV